MNTFEFIGIFNHDRRGHICPGLSCQLSYIFFLNIWTQINFLVYPFTQIFLIFTYRTLFCDGLSEKVSAGQIGSQRDFAPRKLGLSSLYNDARVSINCIFFEMKGNLESLFVYLREQKKVFRWNKYKRISALNQTCV